MSQTMARTGWARRAAALAAALLAAPAALVAAGLDGELVAAQVTSAAFDGNPATTERIAEGHPTFVAIELSQTRFGDGAAPHAVLSRDDTFADSVAGSGLTGEGPLLFTPTGQLSDATSDELRRVVASGGRVYLLGGPAALSTTVEQQVRGLGFNVTRLAGATRVETAVAVADAVRSKYAGRDVLIARAWGPTGNDTAAWADSVAGGAVAAARRIPILVTPTAGVAPPVAEWVRRDAPSTITLLGGEAALSPAVAAALPGARRVAGAERTATAAAIATELWPRPADNARKFVVSNGASPAGWTYGFAAAGIAAANTAPVLLVTTVVTDATTTMVRSCGSPQVDLVVVGDGTVVPAPLREQLDVADGNACGPGGAIVYPTNLDSFPDCAAVLAYFHQSALERVGPYGLEGVGPVGGGRGVPTSPTTTVVAQPAPEAGAGGATDDSFSTTNTQEEGVDEPDIVKTDGRFLYSLYGQDLRVVRIDSGTPQLAARLTVSEPGQHELLLSGNRLLIVSRSFNVFIMEPGVGGGDAAAGASIAPAPTEVTTTLTAVDVTNPAAPTVLSKLKLEGDYRSARMIGSVVRVVVQTDPAPMPFVYPATSGADAEQVAAAHNRDVIKASTLDDWLPAYQKLDTNGQETGTGPVVSCSDVHEPPIFAGLGTLSVVSFDMTGPLQPTSSAGVVAAGDTVYASMSRVFVSTSRWGWDPVVLGNTGVTTEVHGFDISSPTATRYVASGAVPGYILNQFALSEHNGYLRIATTNQPPWREDEQAQTDNGVHVLAEQANQLVEVGKVRGLGRGERITGVRFWGDLGAVVTFRQIDPLFLIDLSQPTAPRVAGELKIPGFSAYLHRVGPNRLLGVGRDADLDGRVLGAQVSLFDISNRSAPQQLSTVKFVDGFSSVEFDHHAFTYWPATNLAIVPVSQFTRDPSTGGVAGFNGAVGIRVLETLSEVGRASHAEEAPNGDATVSRSVISGSTVFTVSGSGIEAGDLTNLAKRSFLPL